MQNGHSIAAESEYSKAAKEHLPITLVDIESPYPKRSSLVENSRTRTTRSILGLSGDLDKSRKNSLANQSIGMKSEGDAAVSVVCSCGFCQTLLGPSEQVGLFNETRQRMFHSEPGLHGELAMTSFHFVELLVTILSTPTHGLILSLMLRE